MVRFTIILILLAASAGTFFLVIDPIFQETKTLKLQITALNETFSNSKQIQEVRDTLFSKFKAIPETDLLRLEKMLPDNVDNVKLILELDRIASERGVDIKRINVQTAAAEEAGLGPSSPGYGALGIGLTVTGPYSSFKGFLVDLEQSLRLSDVTALNFRAAGFDFDQYNMTLRTYWLR